jgi:hypothetical protein
MNGVQIRRQFAVATLLMTVGCGGSSRVEPLAPPQGSGGQTGEIVGVVTEVSTLPAQSGGAVLEVKSTSTVFTADTVGALRVEGGVVVMPVVTGFVPDLPKSSGPGIEGLDHRYVGFGDPRTGRRFVVGVGSGPAVKDALLSPERHGYQPLEGVRNGESQVYVRTLGDPAKDAAASIEVAWAVSDHEVIAVAGQGMTLDELLEIAQQVQVEVTK